MSATVLLPSGQLVLFNENASNQLIQQTSKQADGVVNGTLTGTAGAGAEVIAPVEAGQTMCVFYFKGVYASVTAICEASHDGGATWMGFQGSNIASGAPTTTPLSLNTNSTVAWEAAIPAGSTHVRVHCTAYTSGTVEVSIAQGASNYETVVGAVLGATGTIIGGTIAPGTWTDLSSTVLGSAAKFQSPVIDVTATATAVAFTNGSVGMYELRLSATSDQTGTLFLEVSRDNVTFKKVKSVETTKATGCEFYAEIIHKPSTRYVRFEYVNGATLQTFFSLQVIRVSD
jgi:hypothetical protein